MTMTAGWREYVIEGGLLAVFMVSASAFTILVEHPRGVLSGIVVDPVSRRLVLGVAMGVVTKTGAWFTFDETRLGQGREAAKEFLKGAPDLAAEIDRRIRAKISEVNLPVEGIEEAE